MKMPERSRTSRIPLMYSPFDRKSFCHDVLTHTHTPHNSVRNWRENFIWTSETWVAWTPFRQKPGNHIFWPGDLDLWPTTLTYNPSLANLKVNSHTKVKVIGQMIWPWEYSHTDTHRKTAPILWSRPQTWEVTSPIVMNPCITLQNLNPLI